ncbi:FkbM family methyltransferase [Rhodobacteraceae bacterium XHP0102]|nr:FkbM family methyltransferase [Rhodobacteraceae bacterium XHP0102]
MKKLLQLIARNFGYDLHKININSKSRSTLLHLLGRKRHEELVIFDVGAHQGQTIEEYSKLFPNARFFSFEPFPETYERLAKRQSDKVRTFPFGLSDKVESQTFFTNKGSGTNSLLVLSDAAQITWSGHQDLHATGSVTCDFSTLDQFVAENAIASIDFLKIDVQGAEYKVLTGGENTLKSGIVSVVKCEVILSETYLGQHSLHEYLARFDELGFELVNICDQVYGSNGSLIQVDLILQHRQHR